MLTTRAESNLKRSRMSSEFSNGAWSVWVGGAEVNDYQLGLRDAQDLAREFTDDGYDDVYVLQVIR